MAEIILACISLFISIVAIIYTIISNTKKYELKYQHRMEILDWYKNTNAIITHLIEYISSDEINTGSLEMLSNQIDTGRFYYPNIIEDDFGKEKPSAFRGYRNAIIEVLVMIYDLFKMNNKKQYYRHAKALQRVFTSYVFDSLSVRAFNKEISKVTGHIFDNKNINDYLDIKDDENSLYKYLNANE